MNMIIEECDECEGCDECTRIDKKAGKIPAFLWFCEYAL